MLSLSLYSKKDPELRHRELLEAVSGPLLKYLKENIKDLVLQNAMCTMITNILLYAVGDPQPVMSAIATIAEEDFVPGGTDGEVWVYLFVSVLIVLLSLSPSDQGNKDFLSRFLCSDLCQWHQFDLFETLLRSFRTCWHLHFACSLAPFDLHFTCFKQVLHSHGLV